MEDGTRVRGESVYRLRALDHTATRVSSIRSYAGPAGFGARGSGSGYRQVPLYIGDDAILLDNGLLFRRRADCETHGPNI